MRLTTLCYIEKDEQYLMLHRIKKENDMNYDKWIAPGGKFEANESPEECMLREVFEETRLSITSYRYRGLVTFVSDEWETEYMFIYTADAFTGSVIDCNEGDLEWVDKEKLMSLNLWEGDRIFLKKLLDGAPLFSLKLFYQGGILKEHKEFF